MRVTFNRIPLVIFLSLFLWNCSSDDDKSTSNEDELGSIQIKFENRFENLSPIVLNQTVQTSTNGQKHRFSQLKYIVSNFTLTKNNGQTFSYHLNDPDKGAFIVDQNNAILNEITFNLDMIPAGVYTKVKFGLGISQDDYLLGMNSQGQFWADATAAGMTWSWAAGYIFAILEGQYGTTEPNVDFSNHTGNMGIVEDNGTHNLYREVELNFPTPMEVSAQRLPAIHITADFNQFLSGQTPIILDDSNHVGMGSSDHLLVVSNNLSRMFAIDHIHND